MAFFKRLVKKVTGRTQGESVPQSGGIIIILHTIVTQ